MLWKNIFGLDVDGYFISVLTGPGRLTKRGYHKLSDGGGDDCVIPLQDSETEGTSSFSGTDCSDYDGDNVLDADTESESGKLIVKGVWLVTRKKISEMVTTTINVLQIRVAFYKCD